LREIKEEKRKIREHIWKLMEERGVARFPKPIRGRIPNFIGAEKAAEKLSKMKIFKNAEILNINPDSPQKPIREKALINGKKVLMPTPKLREGFILLDPKKIPIGKVKKAATIRGAFKYGSRINLDNLPKIDLMVMGSVAVTLNGNRLGKGGGYSDLEYGILRSLKCLNGRTPIITTVHEMQIVNWIPQERHDVKVDYIITPRRIIKVGNVQRNLEGIIWEKLNEEKFREIPILRKLRV